MSCFQRLLDFSMSQPQKHGGPWATETDIIYEHMNRRVVCMSLRQLMCVCVCHSVYKHKLKQQELFWLCVFVCVTWCAVWVTVSLSAIYLSLSLSHVFSGSFVICWYQLASVSAGQRKCPFFILSFIRPSLFQTVSVILFLMKSSFLTYHNFISPQMRWKNENVIKCFIMVHHRVNKSPKMKILSLFILLHVFPNPYAGKQK